MRAFIVLAQGPLSGFSRPLAYETGRRRAPGQLAGRWLLSLGTDESTEPVMAVEAQAYFRQFRVLHVLIGTGGRGLPERGDEALSLMLSALMILTKCDVIKLIADTPQSGAALAELGWGESRMAWSPRDPFLALMDGAEVGETRTLVSVDPHEWWVTEHGARDKQTLSYLEKRMDMAERLKPSKKPRQAVFERISKLLRWT